LEEGAALVILAAPTPNVLAIAVGAGLIEECGGDAPHDDAETEEEDSEAGVVHSNLFGPLVPATYVAVEDDHTHEE